jgi:hypothetical protein
MSDGVPLDVQTLSAGSKFQVTVNNKTAQALGLSLSPTLLAQIDEVIE